MEHVNDYRVYTITAEEIDGFLSGIDCEKLNRAQVSMLERMGRSPISRRDVVALMSIVISTMRFHGHTDRDISIAFASLLTAMEHAQLVPP